jgi:hypothetical protein
MSTDRIMTLVGEGGVHRRRDLRSREGGRSRNGMLMRKTVREPLRVEEVTGKKQKGG